MATFRDLHDDAPRQSPGGAATARELREAAPRCRGCRVAALRRSARIVRGVLAHYWAAALCLAAALGGVLYLAIAHLGGAGQVWTSIAAIGSTMGISARSIRSAISRLTSEAERPVLIAAEEDAKAWAITTLPPAGLTVGARAGAKNHGVQRGMDFGQQPKG